MVDDASHVGDRAVHELAEVEDRPVVQVRLRLDAVGPRRARGQQVERVLGHADEQRRQPDGDTTHGPAGGDRTRARRNDHGPGHRPAQHDGEEQALGSDEREQRGHHGSPAEPCTATFPDERRHGTGDEQRGEPDLHAADRAPQERSADGDEHARPRPGGPAEQRRTEPARQTGRDGATHHTERHGERQQRRTGEPDRVSGREHERVQQAARTGRHRIARVVLERVSRTELGRVLQMDVGVVDGRDELALVVGEVDDDEHTTQDQGQRADEPGRAIAADRRRTCLGTSTAVGAHVLHLKFVRLSVDLRCHISAQLVRPVHGPLRKLPAVFVPCHRGGRAGEHRAFRVMTRRRVPTPRAPPARAHDTRHGAADTAAVGRGTAEPAVAS